MARVGEAEMATMVGALMIVLVGMVLAESGVYEGAEVG